MNKRIFLLTVLSITSVLAVFGIIFHLRSQPVQAELQLIRPLGCVPLADGRYLITDGGGADWSDGGSKILIINRRGTVEWSFSHGLRFAHSAIMLKNGNILIPDTNNDRLLEVGLNKRIIWSSETWGDGSGRLSDGSHLNYPNYVQELTDGHFLVSDRLNSRVIEIDRTGRIYWQYTGAAKQHAPKYIGDGRYLVADSHNNRILEIDRAGRTLWRYAAGLSWPRDAEKLSDGNILITDSRNNRLLVVTPAGKVVSEIKGHFSAPYQASPLKNGNYLVSDAQHSRVLELTPSGKIVWEFRNLPRPKLSTRLTNGNIEALDSVGQPISWTICDLTAHNTGVWSVDSKVSRGGRRSLSIQDKPAVEITNKWWGQRVKVKPGNRYKLTAYLKTEDVRGGALISLGYLDRLGGATGGVNSAVVQGTQGWRELTVVFKAPKDIASVNISLSLMGSGKVWFDDVSFDRI